MPPIGETYMATADERVARLRLRFETTAQDLQRARTAVGTLVREVDTLEAKQRQLDAQYARSIQLQIENARALNQNSNFVSNLRSDLSALANTQENVNQAQEASNRSTSQSIDLLDRYRRAVDSARISEEKRVGSVGAGTAGRLGQVDRFGRVGGQILGGLGANEAANAVNLVGDVADSFTLLNPVMLAVTAAGIGLAAVFGDIQRGIEAAKQAGIEFAQRQLTNQQLIESGATTADAQGLRDDAASRAQIFGEQVNQLSAIRNELEQIRREAGVATSANLSPTGLGFEGDRASQLFRQFQQITGITVRSVDEMNAALGGTVQNAITAAGEVLNYNQLLLGNAFQVNDIAQANERFTGVLGSLGGAVTTVIDAFNEAKQGANEAAQALTAYNSEKTKEIQLAREATAAAAAELRAQGLTDITNELFEAQTAVVEASNAERIAQEALAAAQGKVTQNIREFEIAAEQERAENIQDAGEQRAKIAQDTEDRILDIQRKAGRSILDAIGNRDALAARNAAENAKEQISDERREAQKRLRELEDNLKKQNRMVDERLRERIRLEQQRGVEEINLKRQLLLQAQTDLRNANNAELLIRRQANIMFGQEAYLGGKSMVAFFKAGVDEALRAGMGGKGGSMGGKTQGSYFYTAPQFTGTLAPAPPSPFQFTTPQGGTPVTFAPTITGQTRQQVQKQLDARVNQVVEFMFTGRQMTA